MTATEDATALDLERFDVSPDALYRIPRPLALRHDVLALSSDHNLITVAIPDSRDSETIERIRLATGMHVRAFEASREAIRARLAAVYPDGASPVRKDDAPAIRALSEIEAEAIRSGASDVHFDPLPQGGRVRKRVDGVLRDMREVPAELFPPLVSRIKLLAGMDIADRRLPQDGRYTIGSGEAPVEARASCVPTVFGEKIVLRLLEAHSRIPRLEDLGMSPACLRGFRSALDAPGGFVVVCGPTGSGKTTTLYSAVAYRNAASANVCTVEDPVEIRIPGTAQVQVNARAGVTFSSALRAFLRQDPNVVMVGEMRDAETAAAAASAALGGHLVLTTMHARDTASAIERLAGLGADRYVIAQALTAVISQRLLRRPCGACRSGEPAGAERCRVCGGSGYAGRVAVFEAVFPDRALSEAIAEGHCAAAIDEWRSRAGAEDLLSHAVRRARAGETTFEELRRVVSSERA